MTRSFLGQAVAGLGALLIAALTFSPMNAIVRAPNGAYARVVLTLDHIVGRGGDTPQAPAAAAFEQEMAMSSGELMDRWNPLIAAAAQRFGVPAAWIRAVMRQESGGRTVLFADEPMPITSKAGAVGIMQVMPGTYDEMRKEYRLGSDPYNPRDNVYAGAAYLRRLHRRYGYPNMFAAYNGGPGTLEAYLHGQGELPKETRNYLASVTQFVERATAGRRTRRARRVTNVIETAAAGGADAVGTSPTVN